MNPEHQGSGSRVLKILMILNSARLERSRWAIWTRVELIGDRSTNKPGSIADQKITGRSSAGNSGGGKNQLRRNYKV